MNTCRMNGSHDFAVSPSIELLRRDGAPAEHGLAFGLHDLLEALFDAPAQRRIARQEHDAAAVLARLGQLDARLLARFAQELVRHLHQHAGAVAGVFLAPQAPR